MTSHYKILVNDSEPNEFCFMPSINFSTFGYINQTLKQPQPEHRVMGFELAINLMLCLSGLTINTLIVTVLMTNTMLRNETLTPAILSLISANILYIFTNALFGFQLIGHWNTASHQTLSFEECQ